MIYYYLSGIILIPGLLLSMYATVKVNSTFSRYSRAFAKSGMTAAQVAMSMMVRAGLSDVHIVKAKGHLTDHYDPRSRTLALSESVYNSSSVSAIGVAAHEVGHAIQHEQGYLPLKIRSALVPVVNISNRLLWPILMIGIVFSFLVQSNTTFGNIFLIAGLIIFGASALFSLVTLPVETNASKRALQILNSDGYLTADETAAAKKVLSAAALTYVTALLVSFLNLLRFLIIFSRFRRD